MVIEITAKKEPEISDHTNLIHIDGSYGEGGGQILRTALALSCVTGRPVIIDNIRKSRPRQGLQPQHLTAVSAAAAISRADEEGAELSSTRLRFAPRRVAGGDHLFDVAKIRGSAGSVSLVLQTVLLPLLFADRPSAVTLLGGTHVPWSPTVHFLKHVFLPVLARMRANCAVSLEQWGWYPKGGGRVTARVEPGCRLSSLSLTDRGRLRRINGISAVSNLPEQIALRQRSRAIELLAEKGIDAGIEIVNAPSAGKGTLLFLLAEFENMNAGFDSLGAIGKRAETVAEEACNALFRYLDSGAAVDRHLADQIVPYLALAPGTSAFTTSSVTRHLLTNIWVVTKFLDVDIRIDGGEGGPGQVTIASRTPSFFPARRMI